MKFKDHPPRWATKIWNEIKIGFEAEYHFQEAKLENISKMHNLSMEPKENVQKYDKIFKVT